MTVVPQARSIRKDITVGIYHCKVAEFTATPNYVAGRLINLIEGVCVSDV